MRLRYNIHRHMDQMERNRKKRHPASQYYFDSDYENTDLVRWLEQNVGKMNSKEYGEHTSGDGWITGMSEIDFKSYVEFDPPISEELATEFSLRFL